MDSILFDFKKLKRNRAFALEHMGEHDFLFQKAVNRMIDNLKDIQREFQNILIIGCRGLKPLIDYLGSKKNITICDIVPHQGGMVAKTEIPDFETEQFDCVLSLCYLHAVNDVPGFLIAIKSYLKADGLFLCSFFGGQSLQELRQSIMQAELDKRGGASQHIHPMIDHYQWAGLLQRAGFALPVVDYDRVSVHYRQLKNLYKDLKNMGEGNALTNRETGIEDLKDGIETYYKTHFYDDGYIATFDIIHGIGWAPHESQQQPARRGSGDVSLTEIL